MPKMLKRGRPFRLNHQISASRKRLFPLVGPELAKLFLKPNSPWYDKTSSLFDAQVKAAFTSRSLRSSIIEFYAEHIDFFRHERATKRLTLEIDELTAGLASTLSFSLLRTGNVSALFRLFTCYHAVQEELMKAPMPSQPESVATTKNTLRRLSREWLTPTRPVEQKKLKTPASVKTIYSVNRSTERDIQRLMLQMQLKKMALVRNLIERAARKTETEKIKLFYAEHRNNLEKQEGPMIPMRLNLPVEIDALHDLLAAKLFDSDRMKSKALRIIVAYYVAQPEL